MKTPSLVKALSLSALLAVSLNTGLAQADNRSCLFGTPPQAVAPQANNVDGGSQAMLNSMQQQMNQQMERIEHNLRNGQISPMQAGKLMREQWEAMQFQRGFLEGGRVAGAGRAAGGESCGLQQDAKAIAAKLAPVVGNMAAEGMQTATTVMRAIARGADKLIRDEALTDERF